MENNNLKQYYDSDILHLFESVVKPLIFHNRPDFIVWNQNFNFSPVSEDPFSIESHTYGLLG